MMLRHFLSATPAWMLVSIPHWTSILEAVEEEEEEEDRRSTITRPP